MTMTKRENYLQDIIRLQLRKPKNWNWELSTSKSSPHISLPVIQLYDSKGNLLVQTKDTRCTQRQSWHSADVSAREKLLHIRKQLHDSPGSRLQRCRSDTADQNSGRTLKKESIIRNVRNDANNKLIKSPSTVLDGTKNGRGADVVDNWRTRGENTISREVSQEKSDRRKVLRIRKTKSDVLDLKDNASSSSSENLNGTPSQKNATLAELIRLRAETRRHKRSASDDLFRRKLKYNEESIKRAECDGYKNFITPNINGDKSPGRKPQRNKMTAENVLLANNVSNIEVNNITHKRYTTRTSSAGTLVISEESFKRHRRRRSKPEVPDAIMEPATNLELSRTKGYVCPIERVGELRQNEKRRRHARYRSDPEGRTLDPPYPVGCSIPNQYVSNGGLCGSGGNTFIRSKSAETSHIKPRNGMLSNSKSSTYLFRELSNEQDDDKCNDVNRNVLAQVQGTIPGEGRKSNIPSSGAVFGSIIEKGCERTGKGRNNYNRLDRVNSNKEVRNLGSHSYLFRDLSHGQVDNKYNDPHYVVQEPTTPSDSRKSSIPISVEESVAEKSGSFRKEGRGRNETVKWKDYNQYETGHLVKQHNKLHSTTEEGSGGGGGDSDLLQLVRRLSSNDHVNMGANVSRHSAKGLSGRRSQSSGSICNGKGRHPDGKICSSLPSYLDERENGNGCNNNHNDCEKQPLDEVDRIPPLGDGAPLHWKFSDQQTALCDQGYGSERSPEEEYPPPLPDHDKQCHRHLEPHACYPFITPESTFCVKLLKGSRGLGLSVTGGVDSTGAWPGLIRIKRLFPHQPASTCGLLNVGDLLIEANGITLTGLSNYEALEVLRTAPNQVELKVCRPPPDVLNCVSPISEVPPPPPRREPPSSLHLPPTAYSSPEDDYYHGEFEVTLTKIQGSLGFTLRKEDDSALGHYVRALVREPALTDGRIRAGDKIIAVNDVEISPMSHEQAVQYLRQCGDVVKLRLYRDCAQTPVATLSPTETTPRTSFSRKAHLRQEAVDMLNDIAVRKLIPGNQDTYRRSLSPNASPRRLRRHPCPSDASHVTDPTTYMQQTDSEQFHEGLLQKCSHPFDDDAFNSLFSIESDDGDRPPRPSSLELYNPNQTPVATRKPRFNFSLAHNQYELNNLDPEVLDAPNLTYNLGNDDTKSTDVECGDSFPQEPASMPHIPLDTSAFSYKNPAYQSAHPPCGTDATDDRPAIASTSSTAVTSSKPIAAPKPKPTTDDTNMRKWKGVTLDKEETKPQVRKMRMPEEYEVLAIELNRGWNSRLGFSLQGAAGVTYVSAVHADSVAAKDGRLKPGDRVIKVNDESVENMTTNEIIDLLRIVRGPVCIVISRVKSNEDCPKSNAEN
ncbi:uncharacterized protein LOC109609094 isoform X2 [Aethina tumida]|uniref:uncharacterized protein LOC109609094 isoform X2 n=1 Tax=Aethina tumida TaxID=116153 RepID=UPI00214940A7|nr:uncharacterized protein LOC109609094 isoform X2 [Aethina tumida]